MISASSEAAAPRQHARRWFAAAPAFVRVPLSACRRRAQPPRHELFMPRAIYTFAPRRDRAISCHGVYAVLPFSYFCLCLMMPAYHEDALPTPQQFPIHAMRALHVAMFTPPPWFHGVAVSPPLPHGRARADALSRARLLSTLSSAERYDVAEKCRFC